MTAVDDWIAELKAGRYSSLPQNLISDVDTVIAALQSLGTGIPPVQGTTTNDNAPPGFIGEELETIVLVGTQVPLVSNISKNMGQLALTAGDWDLSFFPRFNFAATTRVWFVQASLSLATNALNSTTPGWFASLPNGAGAQVPADNYQMNIGPVRVSIAVPTTYFGVGLAFFDTSTANIMGLIRARRMR